MARCVAAVQHDIQSRNSCESPSRRCSLSPRRVDEPFDPEVEAPAVGPLGPLKLGPLHMRRPRWGT